MKKGLVVLLAAFALVGCGNGVGQTTTATVCTTDKPYRGYSSAKQTIISEGDIAKKIEFEGVMVMPNNQILEATLPQLDEAVKSVNSLEGVSAAYEKVDDVTLKDIASYDLEKASLQTLIQIGLLQSSANEKTKAISVEQTVKALEKQGFTCSVE